MIIVTQLPFFEEDSPNIPAGYGIEHSHDGGFYPYRLNVDAIEYIKDEQGLDLRCTSRNEAFKTIVE
jgi:hypothetical protein